MMEVGCNQTIYTYIHSRNLGWVHEYFPNHIINVEEQHNPNKLDIIKKSVKNAAPSR
jgi:hypothetical protein